MPNWNEPVRFLGCACPYADASVVLFGAPYDGTTSYRPGARFASRVMRAESYSLETYSPYQDLDLIDFAICDGGDLDLPFGGPEPALDLIEQRTRSLLADGKIPVMIGGEHLVSLGAVRAAAALVPDLHLLHFDAHCDLRDDYLGARLSHATVMRRCWDLLGDDRIHQFGIRSGERDEFRWGQTHVMCRRYDFTNLAKTVGRLRNEPVYLSIDLDVLDPSVLPGTGTPEAGGVSFADLLEALLSLRGLSIVAADLNELSPPHDPSGQSTAVALKVLRELLLVLAQAAV